MPLYSFINDETEEVKDIFMSMNEEHKFVDERGKEWRRIFHIPQARVDGKINCWSKNSFVEKTGKYKNGKLGDIWDLSAELSTKRAKENGGIDPLSAKAKSQWSRERNGKRFPDKPKDVTIEI